MHSQARLKGGACDERISPEALAIPNSHEMYKHRKIDSLLSSSLDKHTMSGISDNTTRHTATTEEILRLTDLPNELLLKIAGFLRPDFPWMEKEERFDGRERTMFVTDVADLVHLSKTCRKLRPVAQEALVHTAVLGGFDGTGSIESLVRLFLARPGLGKSMRQLRIGIPPRERLYFESDEAAEELRWSSKLLGPLPSDLIVKVDEIIADTPLHLLIKHLWGRELRTSYARPLCGVLLALVPNLDHLSLSHSLGGASPNRVLRQMFGIREDDVWADFSTLPALTNLRYLNDATPENKRPLSSLTIEPQI